MAKKRIAIGKYRTVFRGVLYEIEQARAILPSGKRAVFEQVRRNPTVTVLPIDTKGRLILIREYMEHSKKYVWSLPAGRLARNETPRTGAQRELREEVGVRARRLRLFFTGTDGRTWKWMRYSFLATDLVSDPLPADEGEDITAVPTPLKKAFAMAVSGKVRNEVNCFLIMKLYLERRSYLRS